MVLQGRGGETRGQDSWRRRSLGASPAAVATVAEDRGGTPDPAAGGGNAVVAAAVVAGTGAAGVGAGAAGAGAGAEDHCTSL